MCIRDRCTWAKQTKIEENNIELRFIKQFSFTEEEGAKAEQNNLFKLLPLGVVNEHGRDTIYEKQEKGAAKGKVVEDYIKWPSNFNRK